MGATAEQLQDTKRKAFARNLERAQSYHLIGARAVRRSAADLASHFCRSGIA